MCRATERTDVLLQLLDVRLTSVAGVTVGREPGDVARLAGLDVSAGVARQTSAVVGEVREALVRRDERRVQPVRRRPVHLHTDAIADFVPATARDSKMRKHRQTYRRCLVLGWRLGVVASVVRRMNEVTVHWARLV